LRGLIKGARIFWPSNQEQNKRGSHNMGAGPALLSKLMSNNLQVSFLPWAKLGKRVTLGPITLWPYYNIEGNQRVSDPEIKALLNKYFRFYVDHQDQGK
jgi:hypothetical protein